MLYIKIENDKVVGLKTSWTADMAGEGWTDRWNWNSYEEVEKLAEMVADFTGKKYLPLDCGSHVSPRFDVLEAPAIGDEVSRTFNGDYYPVGTIVKISDSFRVITTSEGKWFYRDKLSGRWLSHGTWALIPGTHKELNPHF